MAFQPGLPGTQFPSQDALIRRVQDLEKAVQQLGAANPFAPMGMTPGSNGVTFGGSVTINGNLAVPNGSITNAALQNPLSPLVSHVDTTNFALAPGTVTEKLRATINVPSGFTQALVFATATMSAVNSTASTDNLYLGCNINGGSPGWVSEQSATAGAIAGASNSAAALLSPAGTSFYVAAKAATGTGSWAASTQNQNIVNIDVMVIFLR